MSLLVITLTRKVCESNGVSAISFLQRGFELHAHGTLPIKNPLDPVVCSTPFSHHYVSGRVGGATRRHSLKGHPDEEDLKWCERKRLHTTAT